jgi:hypothetical protein
MNEFSVSSRLTTVDWRAYQAACVQQTDRRAAEQSARPSRSAPVHFYCPLASPSGSRAREWDDLPFDLICIRLLGNA